MGKLFSRDYDERHKTKIRSSMNHEAPRKPVRRESAMLACGIRPVMEAVESGKQFERVYIQKGCDSKLLSDLVARLNEAGAPMQFVPVEKLSRMTSANHQGVVALMAPIAYQDALTFLPDLLQRKANPLVVMLDHITDVRNMGAIARTAECAGVDALVLPLQGGAQMNEDAIKTSSGALFRIPVCREANLKTAVHLVKQLGMQVVAATEKGAASYLSLDYTRPTLLIMGAEDTGVSPELLKLCDARVKLPMLGAIQSLNVSVAAGIFMYESLRQRLGAAQ